MTVRALRTAILALLLVLSCAKQPLSEADPDPVAPPTPSDTEKIYLELNRESAQPDGKTALTSSLSVEWEVGDRIAVWDGEAVREFTAESSSDGIVFSGQAVPGRTYWALYPFENCIGVDSSDPDNPVFRTSVPTSQVLRTGSAPRGAMVCLGKGNADDGIYMRNVFGLLKFSLPSAEVGGKQLTALMPGSLDRMTISSMGGKQLVGEISVSLVDGLPRYSGNRTTGDDSIALSFEKRPGAGASYYVCGLPGEMGGNGGGLKIGFSRREDSAVAEISGGAGKENPLVRSGILDFGELRPRWRAADDSAFDESADPSGSFDYSLLSRISHPRVLATDEDFRHLNELLASHEYPELNFIHDIVIARADGLITKTIPTIPELDALIDPDDGSYQNTFNEKLARTSIDHLVTGAYAYRTTRDPKYLADVRKVIAQRCADEFWSKHPQGKSIAYLSPAEITMGMAVAYDWLYYELTETERAAIRKVVTTLPFSVGESTVRTSRLKNEVNNRGQVHNAGIMSTALAVYDKDKAFAKKWMEYSYEGIRNVVEGIYGVSGSTEEGLGYWEYGTGYQNWYNETLFTVFGTDNGLSDQEGFRKTGDYNLYMSDHISPFAFSDGGRATISCEIAPWWLALRFQRPELMATQVYLMGLGRKPGHRIMSIIPISLSKYPRLDLSLISRPSSDVWSDDNSASSPVVLTRTGWNCNDRDKYLGLKGGYASVSHGHMDVGTFEYHANGERWSIDNSVGGYAHYTNKGLSGSGQVSSGSGTYVKWLALAYNCLGHSTIAFSNYDQSIGGVAKTHNTDHIVASSSKATILQTYDTPSEKGGKIDMSKTLKGQVKSATRKAVIKDGSCLLVEDEISALDGSDASMIWRMITPAGVSAEVIGNKSIKLTQAGKTMYVHPEFNGPVSNFVLKNWGAFDSAHPGKTGEWGWKSSDYKVSEVINANVVGFTVTIPRGTKVTVSTTLTEYDPASGSQGGVGGETPGFDNPGQYNW